MFLLQGHPGSPGQPGPVGVMGPPVSVGLISGFWHWGDGGWGEQMIRFDAQLTVTYVRVKDGGGGRCVWYIYCICGVGVGCRGWFCVCSTLDGC